MDIGSIVTAASSIKAVADIAKTLSELKSISEVKTVAIELQSKILAAQSDALAAQSEQASMVQKISELIKEIAAIKAWEVDKHRYKLHSPWEGSVVYGLVESMSNSEPPHWICTKCYEDERKSILNPRRKENSSIYIFVCPVCKSEIHSPFHNAAQAEYVPA